MSGGGEPEAARRGTCVVGTPVEPRAHPANQHAATWVAGEARPASSHSGYLNATPSGSASGFVNLNQSGGENPYVHVAPANGSAPSGRRPMNKICDALNRCGKRFEDATRKAESLADNVWHHLRTSPSITDAAMARLAQGTKVLTEGGHEKVFHHTFEILPGEKLLKAYACYLSTSTGPVIGTLYLSNKRLAFCSDNPLCQYSPSGQQQWMYYKVVLLLDQLSAVSPSSNRLNPSEKYIQVVTRDGYEFWFMGFISYDKALRNINEALQHYRDDNMGGRIQVQ
ncbi:GEM-like protein 2 isoform X1 [Rhodamnia argentea]|uniref:GEM-like protein 2 isoform X1 n=1 Tax=Rhodamnia argentea TaxID=178133 RepID=A0ABM3HMV3_9MYRT|nr:GEM-like protein 2 isoform X1 [Rhodamnia argentea]